MQKEKLVPAIRFKGFDEEWEEYKISELSTYKNGESYEAFFVNNGKYNVINLNSITIGGGLKNSNKFVDICISSPLKKDDVVICLSDVAHGTLLGAAALIPFDNKFVLNQRVGLLRIKSDISPLFFVQSINNKQPYFKYHGAGSSQLNISKKCVEDCTITVPTIVEQHKIGKFMSSLNSLIHSQEQKLEKLQTIKQSLLNKMFASFDQKMPEIRFKEYADEWRKKKINEILIPIISCLTTSNLSQRDKYPIFDANDIAGYTSHSMCDVEYLTIIKDGAGVGRVRKLPAGTGFLGTMTGLVPKNCNIDFAYNLISSLRLEKTYSGSTIPHIYFSDYGKYLVHVPNVWEQQKIGQFFSNLDSLIHSQEQKLEKLNNVKQSLLEKMFC
ncbi:restriction endonuclease subunit S [Mycoplasma sp. Z663]|uniref:restriction endonuclease subunit S n=1 Tax=Mycoplasma sp. Z663 TaxID=3401686 RepID=UPI003AAFFBCE